MFLVLEFVCEKSSWITMVGAWSARLWTRPTTTQLALAWGLKLDSIIMYQRGIHFWTEREAERGQKYGGRRDV